MESAKQVPQRLLTSEHQDFVETIGSAMEDLIVRHGYSRERATRTLLQEIGRSIAPATVSISDDQVCNCICQNSCLLVSRKPNTYFIPILQLFETMRRYRLGSEQSMRALLVSKTLDYIVAQDGLSVRKALSKLTHHIRKAKFTSDPYDSSASSDELEIQNAPATDTLVRIILPEQKSLRCNRAAHNKSNAKSTPYLSNMKSQSLDQFKRERSDSAVEDVVAKLGESVQNGKISVATFAKNQKQAESNSNLVGATNSTAVNKSLVSTPVLGRVKRNRCAGDEASDLIASSAGSSSTSSKRSRRGST
jgi:hypothetical protein